MTDDILHQCRGLCARKVSISVRSLSLIVGAADCFSCLLLGQIPPSVPGVPPSGSDSGSSLCSRCLVCTLVCHSADCCDCSSKRRIVSVLADPSGKTNRGPAQGPAHSHSSYLKSVGLGCLSWLICVIDLSVCRQHTVRVTAFEDPS